MPCRPLVSGVLVGSLVVGAASAQVAAPARTYLYDDFHGRFIDPAKWDGVGTLTRDTMEFVREVKDGHLHIAARTYGERWGDVGSIFDIAELDLKNASTISSFGAEVVVRSISSVSCANNSWSSDPEVQLVGGGFFTIGDGSSDTGNIDALVKLQQAGPAPSDGLIARLTVGVVGGSDVGDADLGRVGIGEPVFMFVRWDQANHRFLGGMKRLGVPWATAVIPYGFDDSRAADYTYRGLSVRNNTPNCVATPTVGAAEAEFSQVMVNLPWQP